VAFTDGQNVKKGDILVVIDSERYQLAVNSAKAGLDKFVAAQKYTEAMVARRQGASDQHPGLIPGEELATYRAILETSAGPIATERVILTGGPGLQAVGAAAGMRIPAGAVRHTVAVLEPHEAFAVERQSMVFDIGAGLYWRLEEGGLLFGWSDPNDRPGEARAIDWAMYDAMRARLARFVPLTGDLDLRKIWAATIDFTPDHLPIIGPGLTAAGERIEGVTVASAGGHGMMWGPAVARVAADLAVHGRTDLVDVSDLGLDRFDAEGRSRLATDPIALPFPVGVWDDDA
jgi:sarcosine oxidase subunit beta